MASNKPLQDIFEKNRYSFDIVNKSKAWFDQQALLLSRQYLTPNKLLKNNPSALEQRIVPGNLYMFLYDAKMKDTLPYWDKFPLVFPFRAVQGGFYGLNMHYLQYKMRVMLMDKLLDLKNNNRFDESTRLKLSWSMIDGVSKYKFAQPCVKHYLNSQIQSPFVKIDSKDWATAMMLPVEQFVGANKNKVWKDSKGMVL